MVLRHVRMSLGLSLIAFVFACGCGKTTPPPAKPLTDAPLANETTSSDTISKDEALAALDPEDREIAVKQATCPVSDKELGYMGKPVKLTHEGQIVFLCCDACTDAFHKEPEKFLAKLKH